MDMDSNIRMDISLTKISCNEIELLPVNKDIPKKNIFDVKLIYKIKQHKLGQIVDIITDVTTIMQNTGESCKISCITTFDIATNYSILQNKTTPFTLSLFSELTLLSISHLRAFFIEKSKNTSFNNIIIPYRCANELQEISKQTLLGMMN